MSDRQDDIRLYHYTNKQGARGIQNSGFIQQSSRSLNPRDAVFGDGVYLTSAPPGLGKHAIAANNYDDGAAMVNQALSSGKVDRYVGISMPRYDVQKVPNTGRDVYRYNGNLDLNRKDIDWRIGKM